MGEAFLAILGNLLPGLVSDVSKRVLPPEKMSEEERAKLSTELTLEMMKQDWSVVEAEFKDRADARSLAAQEIAKGNAFTAFLAATVRPVWGYGALAAVTYSVLTKTPIDPSLKDIIQTVLQFFFGGRVIEKVTPAVVTAVRSLSGKN